MKKLAFIAVFLLSVPAFAGTPAKVLSVYDGDTFHAEVEHFPHQIYRGPVRVAGIDAPEIKGACAAERAAAVEAREALKRLLVNGVVLDNLRLDKYGRLLARVTVDGQDVASHMIVMGLARAYSGAKRESWC